MRLDEGTKAHLKKEAVRLMKAGVDETTKQHLKKEVIIQIKKTWHSYLLDEVTKLRLKKGIRLKNVPKPKSAKTPKTKYVNRMITL